MKRLDDNTLEVIAETICGGGEGAGGGYESPAPYRTKSQIYDFFRRIGVQPQGTSSTRKWLVLESLQALNGTSALEAVLRRLASPKEYRGDSNQTQSVVDHLNQVLRVEGLEIEFLGIDAQIRERTPTATSPKPKQKPTESPPEFSRLIQDASLAAILAFRWDEAQRCAGASAYLSAVVMMGSLLEGILLYKLEQNPKIANEAKSSPKDRQGKPRPIQEWGLASLIEVAHELRWLQGDVRRFSHGLRESRNIVHPYVERLHGDKPDEHTSAICWQVVRAAVADLLQMD